MFAKNSVLNGTAAAIAVAVLSVSGFTLATDLKQPAAINSSQVARETARADTSALMSDFAGHNVNGAASWYGAELDGRRDARGERFDLRAMTAAVPPALCVWASRK